MGNFDDVGPDVNFENLTSENIEQYLRSLVLNKHQIYDPTGLREAMAGLKFLIRIHDPPARITTYCADIFERLDAVVYGEFKTENPKRTIKLLIERIIPPAMNSAMQERVKVEA